MKKLFLGKPPRDDDDAEWTYDITKGSMFKYHVVVMRNGRIIGTRMTDYMMFAASIARKVRRQYLRQVRKSQKLKHATKNGPKRF